MPLWLRALTIYAGLRMLMAIVFVIAWITQPGGSRLSGAYGDFFDFLSLSWDGSWYRGIALDGYPASLPTDPATGETLQSAWAFYPAFPLLTRGVMMVTALPWTVAAPLVAFIVGAVAVVVVAYLVRDAASAATHVRPGLPELAVAALTAFPTGATAMVAYSESTALALIATSLLLIHRRAYVWALLPVLALGFTRAVALPMAAVVVWHGVMRWLESRNGAAPLPAADLVKLAVLVVTATASGIAWPLIVSQVTAVPDAYFRLQSVWRDGSSASSPFSGVTEVLEPWVHGGALPLVVGASVLVAAVSLTRPARRLGPELQAWGRRLRRLPARGRHALVEPDQIPSALDHRPAGDRRMVAPPLGAALDDRPAHRPPGRMDPHDLGAPHLRPLSMGALPLRQGPRPRLRPNSHARARSRNRDTFAINAAESASSSSKSFACCAGFPVCQSGVSKGGRACRPSIGIHRCRASTSTVPRRWFRMDA